MPRSPASRYASLAAALLLGLVLTATGCRSAGDGPPGEGGDAGQEDVRRAPDGSENADADVVSGVGTIRYIDLEGGFYGIESADGDRYNPSDLPERFREDGLEVRFRLRIVRDRVTIQMWGQPVDVLSISVADGPDE